MSEGLPRLHPDARTVVDGPAGLQEWSGARWNDYAAECERKREFCPYTFVHIQEPQPDPDIWGAC